MSIFDDLAGIDDAMEITIGDKTVKVGDLKSAYSGERTRAETLAAERDTLNNQYRDLTQSVQTLLGAAGRAAERGGNEPPNVALDVKAALREAMRSAIEPEDPTNAIFEDKLFGRAFKTVEDRINDKIAAETKRLSEQFTQFQDTVNKGFQGMAGAQVVERETRWYDVNRNDIPKKQDGKRVTLDELRQYADQNGFHVQGTQLRDFDRALDALTAPTRREHELEEARQKAYQEGLNAGRTNAGKVIPLMGDRSAGGTPKGEYSTQGKTARQMVSERIAQGLADLSAEGTNE